MNGIKLTTIGGGIHAVFYRSGQRIGDRDLGEEVCVQPATAADLVNQPRTNPTFVEYDNGKGRLIFTGYYVVPDFGFAAIFGAMHAEPAACT